MFGVQNLRVKELVLPTSEGSQIDVGKDVYPSATQIGDRIDGIQNVFKEASQRVFKITWDGSGRCPQGAELLGKTIATTQHGRVQDTDGQDIGFYERIIDGENDKHEMKVFVNRSVGTTETN